MAKYFVQVKEVENAIEVHSEVNPEREYSHEENQSFLIFKRNDEVIGKFVLSAVIGWWRTN